MQFEELIKLVREVGNAGLSDFEYKEGELFIKMSAAGGQTPSRGGLTPKRPSVYQLPKGPSGDRSLEGRDQTLHGFEVETNIPMQGQIADQPESMLQGQSVSKPQGQSADQPESASKGQALHESVPMPQPSGDLVPAQGRMPSRRVKEQTPKKVIFEAPVEGVFWFERLDGTPCPLNCGDYVQEGQILGRLECRGRCFEIPSTVEGEVVNIYIVNGEEIVAREALFMVVEPY